VDGEGKTLARSWKRRVESQYREKCTEYPKAGGEKKEGKDGGKEDHSSKHTYGRKERDVIFQKTSSP